jgi:hypothetical protein
MLDPTQRHPAGNRVPRKSSSRTGSSQDSTPTLLDGLTDEGCRSRDDGMRQAEHGAAQGVRVALKRTIEDLATEDVEFTADDVRARCAPLGSPHALGAALGAAARNGLIECVGIATSSRPERHAGLLRVWRGVTS